MLTKASRQNSYAGKIGKSPQQGGGQEFYRTNRGGVDIFKNLSQPKNRIFSDKKDKEIYETMFISFYEWGV